MTTKDLQNNRAQKVKIEILNREFAVACSQSEKPALLDAAKMLDTQLRKLRSQGISTSAFDQLLVVVALNLCNEVKNYPNRDPIPLAQSAPQISIDSIERLIAKIDNALAD